MYVHNCRLHYYFIYVYGSFCGHGSIVVLPSNATCRQEKIEQMPPTVDKDAAAPADNTHTAVGARVPTSARDRVLVIQEGQGDPFSSMVMGALRRLMMSAIERSVPPRQVTELRQKAEAGGDIEVVGLRGLYDAAVLCCTSHPNLTRSDEWSLAVLPPSIAVEVLRSPLSVEHMVLSKPVFVQLPDSRPQWGVKLHASLQTLAIQAITAAPTVDRQSVRRAQRQEQIRLHSIGAGHFDEDDLVDLQPDDDLELPRPLVARCTVPPPRSQQLEVLRNIIESAPHGDTATSHAANNNEPRGARAPLSLLNTSVASESVTSRVPVSWLAPHGVGTKGAAESGPYARQLSRLLWFASFDGINQLDLSCEGSGSGVGILQQLRTATSAVRAVQGAYLTNLGAGRPLVLTCEGSVVAEDVKSNATVQVLLRDVREVRVENYHLGNPSANDPPLDRGMVEAVAQELVASLTSLVVGTGGKSPTVVKSSLQHLSFANSPMLDTAPLLKAIAEVVRTARKELDALAVEGNTASMEGVPMPQTPRSLRALVYPLCPLRSLDLSGCQLPLTSLCLLMSQSPTLTRIIVNDPVRVPRPSRAKGSGSLPVGAEVYFSGEDDAEGVRLVRACRRYATHISLAGVGLADTPELARAFSELLLGIDFSTGVRCGDEYASAHHRELNAAAAHSHSAIHRDHVVKGGVVSLNVSRNSLGRFVARAIGEALLDARRGDTGVPPLETSAAEVRRFQLQELDLSDNDAFGQESLLFLLKCMAGSRTLRSVRFSQKSSIERRLAAAASNQPAATLIRKRNKSNATPTALPVAPTASDLTARAAVLGVHELRPLLEFFLQNAAVGAPLEQISLTFIQHEMRCVEALSKALLGGDGGPLHSSLTCFEPDTVSLPHLVRCDEVEQCVASFDSSFADESLFPHLHLLRGAFAGKMQPEQRPSQPPPGRLTDYHVLNTQLMRPAAAMLAENRASHSAFCVAVDDGVVETAVGCLRDVGADPSLIGEVCGCLRRMAAEALLHSIPGGKPGSGAAALGVDGSGEGDPLVDFSSMSYLFADVCVFTGTEGYAANATSLMTAVQPKVVAACGGGEKALSRVVPCGPFAKLAGLPTNPCPLPTPLALTAPHGAYFVEEVVALHIAACALPSLLRAQ